jgi:hypothetical protein
MFIQWCVKGIRGRLDSEDPGVGINDAQARAMIDRGRYCQKLCMRSGRILLK